MMTSTIFMMASLVMFADDAAPDAPEKEFKKLEGDWIPVGIKQGGKIRGPDFPVSLHIKAATARIEPGGDERALPARVFALKAEVRMRAGGEERALGSLTINPLQELRTFDLAVEKDFAGFGGNVILGIYQWEGDVLKLGLNNQIFGERPTRFDWVAILTRDTKKEREAAAELARVLPFENPDSRVQCRGIVKAHPKTAAAMIAQEYLDYGLFSEQDLQEARQASRLLNLAKKGPKGKARDSYMEIVAKYPGTKAAKEASKLRIELDDPAAAMELQFVKKLVKDGKKEEARQGYLKIIDSYPETAGAKETKHLLAELEASIMLDLAQKLAKSDSKQKVCETCKEIVRLYPGTMAASKAKELIVDIRLEMVQNLAQNGCKHRAWEICKETIRLYPETLAVKKCQELLAELTQDLDAAWKLNLAKMLAEDGLKLGRDDLKEKARTRCQEIIELYPKAAAEAKKLLERLSNDRTAQACR